MQTDYFIYGFMNMIEILGLNQLVLTMRPCFGKGNNVSSTIINGIDISHHNNMNSALHIKIIKSVNHCSGFICLGHIKYKIITYSKSICLVGLHISIEGVFKSLYFRLYSGTDNK